MSRIREIKKQLLIFTNGKVTEKEYFEHYRDCLQRESKYLLKVATPILGDIENLVETVVKERAKKYPKSKGNEIWLVFDIDDFYQENREKVQKAINLAKKHGLNLAWSNRCFELWFLLHFEEVSVDFSGSDYHEKLRKHFKKEGLNYEKNINLDKLFNILIKNTQKAIKNADKIDEKDFRKNPSTKVHEILLKLDK